MFHYGQNAVATCLLQECTSSSSFHPLHRVVVTCDSVPVHKARGRVRDVQKERRPRRQLTANNLQNPKAEESTSFRQMCAMMKFCFSGLLGVEKRGQVATCFLLVSLMNVAPRSAVAYFLGVVERLMYLEETKIANSSFECSFQMSSLFCLSFSRPIEGTEAWWIEKRSKEEKDRGMAWLLSFSSSWYEPSS